VKARYLLGLAAAALLVSGCKAAPRPAPVVGISTPPTASAAPVAGAHDRTAAPRTVIGNGLWHVGTEAAAGRWVSYPPTAACRWVVRNDDTPEGFVAGYDGTGWKADTAVYATVKDGQTIETALCGTWLKVG
jgi:hypothetical protein